MRIRFPTVRLVLVWSAAVLTGSADAAESLSGRDPATLYRPFQAERAVLSRDGRRVAYAVYEERQLSIVVQTLEPEPTKVRLSVDDLPYAGVDALEWVSPDRLVLATRTPVIWVLDVSKKSVRRLLDSALFEPWSADQATPRAPHFVGLVQGQPNAIWVEGISQVTADDQDPFSPLANPFAENEPADPSGEGGVPARPKSSFGGLGGGGSGPARVRLAELAKLDLDTGVWESYASTTDRTDGVVLYDRAGHARIKRSGPASQQTYFYQAAEASFYEQWDSFDEALPATKPLRFRVTPDTVLQERSFPIGFGPEQTVFYYASNVGGDTYGLFAFDIVTQRSSVVVKAPAGYDALELDLARPAQALVFDRATRKLVGVRHRTLEPVTTWIDPVLEEVDRLVASKFPRRQVQVLDWDDARSRFLLRVDATNDPGRLFVYHRGDGRFVEFLRVAPWIEKEQSHVSQPFDVVSPGGHRLSGRLTVPKVAVAEKPPLVVWLHDIPGPRTPSGFNRDAQAIADLGMIVLHLDLPGTTGLGRNYRQAKGDLPIDQRAAQACLEAIDWVGTQTRFDPRRVALIGEGTAGYLALRATALHPQRIRGAASINGPTHPEQVGQISAARRNAEQRRQREALARYAQEMENWSGAGPAPVKPIPPYDPLDWNREAQSWFFTQGKRPVSLLSDADRLTRPVMLLHDPGLTSVSVDHPQALLKALKKKNPSADFKPLPAAVHRPDLPIRIPLLVYLRDFLNDTFYRYKVELGDTKEHEGS
ncbi:MAG: prolyl oligopeptidase family serine peptidase [Opitutaceae bacterium]